jgi:hypothetical protein
MGYWKSIVRRVDRVVHDLRCADVVKTAPLRMNDAPVKILSMVCHRDVILYLVAAKSFYQKLQLGSFVLIDDGSLTAEDRDIFNRHLGSPRILHIRDVPTFDCPVGGTWERLLKILELAESEYVIQLDADTLTLGSLDDVRACVQNNISFTLGTGAGRDFVPAADAAKIARNAPGNHLQDVAERNLDRLEHAGALKYVRGCSGFAGFAKEKNRLELVRAFSRQMSGFLGKRWNEWGSEQVTSNFTVANSSRAMVLPYPAYSGFDNNDVRGLEFVHFIGSCRYDAGVYTRLSRQFIQTQPR